MKKFLIGLLVAIVAMLLIIWVISWFRVPEAVATVGAQDWPGGMGTLQSVGARYEAQEANEASRKLRVLADALPKNEAITEFVSRELTRAEPAIGEPPALPDVSPIRELLLNEPIVWEREGGVGEIGGSETIERRVLQMNVARALVASALAKARANDPSAWEDLHAAWNLVRSLEGQPQLMQQTAALSIARMINAAAWKMPLPAPEWLGELQQRDYVRPLIESFQYQTASYWQDGGALFPTKWHADSIEHDRRIAEGLFNETRCDVNPPVNKHGSDLTSIWRRTFRYRAEREATANALRIREGKPIETQSQCSDGQWTLDGNTLRFSREIPTAPPDVPMPLVLRFDA